MKPVYVSQLAVEEQDKLIAKIRRKLIKQGLKVDEIELAIATMLDSKISDCE